MVFRTSHGFLLLAALAGGCTPMPSTDELPKRLAGVGGAAAPIRFETAGAPIDQVVPDSTLTLPAATELALRRDPQLQAAIARVRVALADAKQTRLLPNPVLSVAFRFPEGGGKPVIEAGLTAELLSLVRRPRQIGAADARVRVACAEAVQTALDVIGQTQEAFLTVQALDGELAILGERQKLVERLLTIAEARVKAGEAARLDALTLQAQRAELDADIIEAEAELADQRLALARLLGQPSAEAKWTLAPWSPPAALGTERQWVAAALEHRPDVAALRWELAALGDEEAAAKLSWLDGAVGVAAERDDNWSIGPAVDLPLPVFDWGQAQRDRATATVIEGRHKLTHAGRVAVEETRRAWAAQQSAQRLVDRLQNDLVPLQEKRREQAEAQYKNGLADVTTMLLAEQDSQSARSKLISARKNAALAQTRLVKAAGGPLSQVKP
jgi:cobalt-zinc-cadmium efflux system outer membrane protein